MIAQVRIYTINKNEMDAFVRHFHGETKPLHEQVGIPIVGAWVNRAQNEFIWVRTFNDEQERDQKLAAFRQAAAEAGVKLGVNVAKQEVHEVEPVLVPIQV